MANTVLDSLREQRAILESEIDTLIGADDFDPSDETFTRAKASAEGLDAKIKALVENESRRNAANEIDALSVRSRKSAESKKTADAEGRSIGDIFVRSRQYEDYKQAPRGTSGHVQVPFDMLQERAPILTDTFGVEESQRIAATPMPRLLTPVLDNSSRIAVSQNSVEWVHFPADGPVAGVVSEGSAKPEATFSPALKTVNLDIVAHWVTVSRSVAEDQGALRSYMDAELRRGVSRKLEAEAAAVVVANTDIPSDTYGGAGDDVDTLLKAIRIGVGNVQDAGWSPSLVLLNPMDYALMDIDVLGSTLLGPSVGSQFWGVRPVASSAVPAGTAFVGDFATAVANLYRTDVVMYMTDSHASNFTSNLLTILAEARAKTIVHRPEALFKVEAGV